MNFSLKGQSTALIYWGESATDTAYKLDNVAKKMCKWGTRLREHNVTVSTFNCPKCPDGIISYIEKDRLCEYTALSSLNVSYVENVCHSSTFNRCRLKYASQ